MEIRAIKIYNYKGFLESDFIEFDAGFNVIVGQNNSGKSALLESLQLSKCSHQPHRNLVFARGLPLPQQSRFEVDLRFSGAEIEAAIIQSGNRVVWPVASPGQTSARQEVTDALSESSSITIPINIRPGTGSSARSYPSHGLIASSEPRRAVLIDRHPERAELTFSEVQRNDGDTLSAAIDEYTKKHIYVFNAQRLNVGESAYGHSSVLASNAHNLPQVLAAMQANHDRFLRLNAHVTDILPNIRWVSVSPEAGFKIKVWSVDPATERDDLAIDLNEGGTGVGQILAILYVAMSSESSVIAIDEPNSFLHPGAAKRLIEILREYSSNQYVIATHSSEIIAACEPTTLHLVKWEQGESKVTSMNPSEIPTLRTVLGELGVSLSDVFGPDGIIWVEGETEEECFPLLARHALGSLPRGVRFIALRSTSDVERNNKRADEAYELYGRVSAGGSIVAPAIAFSFDRELRTDQNVQDLVRRPIKTRVLPRRHYECYLLDNEAIAAVLTEDGYAATPELVQEWVRRNRSQFMPRTNERRGGDVWEVDVNAAKLLECLFQEITEATGLYRKRTHSVRLTQWLLANKPLALAEVSSHVAELAEP